MNVIIVAAGKSKRFRDVNIKIPKFLLKLNNLFLIENIFNNYDEKTNFSLVINKRDFTNYQKELNFLKSKYKNLNIYEIPNHNLGPIKSLHYVRDILKDNTVITYCDFLVEWNFDNFKRYCFDRDIVVAYFKGFHPASLGHTTYDYLKAHPTDKSKIIKIKVKKSFTKKKINEPTVVGIYYFKNILILKNIIENIKFSNKEVYISHSIETLIKKKFLVHSYEVKKFICLGTPLDYYQYKNFEKYFNRKLSNQIIFDQMLLPMAGSGTRMKKDKFKTIKPYITIENKPMYFTTLIDHPGSKSNFLVTNKLQFYKYNFKRLLKSINFHTIDLNKPSKSQIHSCLQSKSKVDYNKNILISSCDYGLSYDLNYLKKLIKKKYDVIVWVYKLKNLLYENKNGFAYCKTKKNKITFISEKKTISIDHENDFFLIGTFLFKKANEFFDCIQKSIDTNYQINNEYYIGNSINKMIKDGKKVYIYEVDSWASFGTPLELQIYYYWSDYFYKIKNGIY